MSREFLVTKLLDPKKYILPSKKILNILCHLTFDQKYSAFINACHLIFDQKKNPFINAFHIINFVKRVFISMNINFVKRVFISKIKFLINFKIFSLYFYSFYNSTAPCFKLYIIHFAKKLYIFEDICCMLQVEPFMKFCWPKANL